MIPPTVRYLRIFLQDNKFNAFFFQASSRSEAGGAGSDDQSINGSHVGGLYSKSTEKRMNTELRVKKGKGEKREFIQLNGLLFPLSPLSS